MNAQKQVHGIASPFMKTDSLLTRNLGRVTVGLGVLIFASAAAIINFDRAKCRDFINCNPIVAPIATTPCIGHERSAKKGIQAAYSVHIPETKARSGSSFVIGVTDTTQVEILENAVSKMGGTIKRQFTVPQTQKQHHLVVPG
ncbi:MAG: hypothetical protein NT157_04310 [Candidatus Micrarchaeota archaeon]|nr:hypothetical protein [Candidatus Micrarchaeota archaeon]